MSLKKALSFTFITLTLLLSSCYVPTSINKEVTETFSAKMKGVNVVPANEALSFGDLTFVMGTDERAITATYKSSNLEGTLLGVYIYGPSRMGKNSDPIVKLSGSVTKFELSPQQVKDLKAGLLYVSIISDKYPNGEIRGQILADN